MSKERLKASNVYQSICTASTTGRKRGMSVKEIKKSFHLKNRDLEVLLHHLTTCAEEDDACSFHFEVYRLTPHYEAKKDYLSFDYLDEADVEDVDLEDEKLNNDMYIRIEDSVMILREKLKEADIDWTNASFLHCIQEELKPVWDKISDARMDEDYVVIRGEGERRHTEFRRNKREWIFAAVRGLAVFLERKANGYGIRKSKVLPLGIYHNLFLDQYICVYQDEQGGRRSISLDEIGRLETAREDGADPENIPFQIESYRKQAQKIRMRVRVYREGNVAKKLRELLKNNQLKVEEKEEYALFTFMAEDAKPYGRALKRYGKSVVVVEPEEVRTDMAESTKEALRYYENLPSVLAGKEKA